MIATDPVLIDTRSHSVSLGYRRTLEKEEFFPNCTAELGREASAKRDLAKLA
jgi:hypothetical protein